MSQAQTVGRSRHLRDIDQLFRLPGSDRERDELHIHTHVDGDGHHVRDALQGGTATEHDFPRTIGTPEAPDWQNNGNGGLLMSVWRGSGADTFDVRRTSDGGSSLWRRRRDAGETHVATFPAGHRVEQDRDGNVHVFGPANDRRGDRRRGDQEGEEPGEGAGIELCETGDRRDGRRGDQERSRGEPEGYNGREVGSDGILRREADARRRSRDNHLGASTDGRCDSIGLQDQIDRLWAAEHNPNNR